MSCLNKMQFPFQFNFHINCNFENKKMFFFRVIRAKIGHLSVCFRLYFVVYLRLWRQPHFHYACREANQKLDRKKIHHHIEPDIALPVEHIQCYFHLSNCCFVHSLPMLLLFSFSLRPVVFVSEFILYTYKFVSFLSPLPSFEPQPISFSILPFSLLRFM